MVKVNAFAALVVPTAWAAYVEVAGISVAGRTPVPDSGTVCGLLGALSAKVSVPDSVPRFVGVKVILTLHFLLGASVAPHVFAEIAKLPLTLILLMFSVADPVLVTVTDLAALVVLTT